MKKTLRYTGALFLAAITVVLLLGVLKLSESPKKIDDDILTVRQINVAMPPPPPPPPPLQQPKTNNVSLDLDISGEGQNLAISFNKNLALAEFEVEKPPIEQLTQPDWSIDWQQDWKSFGLDQLDQPPQLLTPIRIRFPRNLYQRGVERALAKLHIVIDEHGKVLLKAITHLDHPELRASLKQAVQQARFSAPTKSGQPVKAEFIWPLELKHS